MIKKADVALFFIILIAGLLISWFSLSSGEPASKVMVWVDGNIYGVYDINENQTIEINNNGHINNFTIKDGSVSMTYSDCANQVCVEKGSITQSKDSIVCLPNRVMAEISHPHACTCTGHQAGACKSHSHNRHL